MEDLVSGSSFWRDKRVLITGHTGFKGSWLSLWLQKWGSDICGIALEPTNNRDLFKVANVSKNMNSIIGNINNLDVLKDVFTDFKPQIIFHMAAQSLVRQSYIDPIETYRTNILGTLNVFEAARSAKDVKAIVNVTSDKCYENKEWDWGYREIDPVGGYDPYSSSKGCSELITAAYRRSFFSERRVGIATARAGNVIGGGDWSNDRLVPDLIKSFEDDYIVPIRNPIAIRPWQHVLEPLSGYLKLAERLCLDPDHYSQAWNFGPQSGDVKKVSWIANRIVSLWGGGVSWGLETKGQPHEARLLMLDISKSQRHLGWHPKWNIHQALERTIDWYKESQTNTNMRDFTINQINEFETTNVKI